MDPRWYFSKGWYHSILWNCNVVLLECYLLFKPRSAWSQRENFFVSFQLRLVISGSAMVPYKLPSVTVTLQMSTNHSPREMRGRQSAWAWHLELPLPILLSFLHALIFSKNSSHLGVQTSNYFFSSNICSQNPVSSHSRERFLNRMVVQY